MLCSLTARPSDAPVHQRASAVDCGSINMTHKTMRIANLKRVRCRSARTLANAESLVTRLPPMHTHSPACVLATAHSWPKYRLSLLISASSLFATLRVCVVSCTLPSRNLCRRYINTRAHIDCKGLTRSAASRCGGAVLTCLIERVRVLVVARELDEGYSHFPGLAPVDCRPDDNGQMLA